MSAPLPPVNREAMRAPACVTSPRPPALAWPGGLHAAVQRTFPVLQEAFEDVVVAADGFQYRAEKPDAPSFVEQKWAWTGTKPGGRMLGGPAGGTGKATCRTQALALLGNVHSGTADGSDPSHCAWWGRLGAPAIHTLATQPPISQCRRIFPAGAWAELELDSATGFQDLNDTSGTGGPPAEVSLSFLRCAAAAQRRRPRHTCVPHA